MADSISAERRSANMSAIRSKGTKPELLVRRLLHFRGYRYRLHGKSVPGKPDLVFSSRRKVIFVHGCFWHQHPGCREGKMPSTRQDYWRPKLEKNQQRDDATLKALAAQGWESIVIWECELKDQNAVMERIAQFLGPAMTPFGSPQNLQVKAATASHTTRR